MKKPLIRTISIIGCVIFGFITLFSGSAAISCLPSDVGAAIVGLVFTIIPLSLLSLSVFGIIMTRTKKKKMPYPKPVQPQQVSKPISVPSPAEKPVQNVLRSDVIKPPLEKKQTAAQKNPTSQSENLNQKRNLQIKVSDYVVFDIETTGLKPDSDEIIELSAIRIRNNSVVDKFSQLVKPTHPVSSLITDITGITNKMLKDAPRISEVLPLFLRFVGDDIVIGHNVVNFDRKFIENACSMFRFPAFNNDAIDTLCISRNCNLNTPNNKLTTLTEYFGINHKNAHRALSDCYATYELYEILKEYGFKEECRHERTQKRDNMDIAYYRNPPRHKYSTSIQETTNDEMLVPQYLKQIEESIDLINNTADPKTFFKRYIFAIDRLSELSKMEDKISFTGQLPSKFKSVMIEKKQAAIIDMIDRAVQKTKEKLLSLKTEKGKTNNINKFRTQFEPFEEEMLPSTLDYLNNVYTELSNSIK